MPIGSAKGSRPSSDRRLALGRSINLERELHDMLILRVPVIWPNVDDSRFALGSANLRRKCNGSRPERLQENRGWSVPGVYWLKLVALDEPDP